MIKTNRPHGAVGRGMAKGPSSTRSISIYLEQTTFDAVSSFAGGRNLSFSSAARILILRGLRADLSAKGEPS